MDMNYIPIYNVNNLLIYIFMFGNIIHHFDLEVCIHYHHHHQHYQNQIFYFLYHDKYRFYLIIYSL